MKRHYPATGRNRDHILDVLGKYIPPKGVVLEIASGSGEHACWFARHLPELIWQPSDPDPGCRASIDCWTRDEGLTDRIRPALDLDAAAPAWPIAQVDALFCANMIHIAPFAAAEGLMAGAGRILPPGGIVVMYGPFKQGGTHTAPSNHAFDLDLQARDPRWGVRDLEDIDALARSAGLDHVATIPMPANNLCVVWRKPA